MSGLNRRLDTASFLGLNLLNTTDLFLEQHLYEQAPLGISHTPGIALHNPHSGSVIVTRLLRKTLNISQLHQ
jgi:hypothetical protein